MMWEKGSEASAAADGLKQMRSEMNRPGNSVVAQCDELVQSDGKDGSAEQIRRERGWVGLLGLLHVCTPVPQAATMGSTRITHNRCPCQRLGWIRLHDLDDRDGDGSAPWTLTAKPYDFLDCPRRHEAAPRPARAALLFDPQPFRQGTFIASTIRANGRNADTRRDSHQQPPSPPAQHPGFELSPRLPIEMPSRPGLSFTTPPLLPFSFRLSPIGLGLLQTTPDPATVPSTISATIRCPSSLPALGLLLDSSHVTGDDNHGLLGINASQPVDLLYLLPYTCTVHVPTMGAKKLLQDPTTAIGNSLCK